MDDTTSDENYLSQDPPSLVGSMLMEQPSFRTPDTASLINPAPQAPTSQPLSPDIATDRAGRYSFATGDYKIASPDMFIGNLVNGQDDSLRNNYAQMDASQQDQRKVKDTQDLLATKLPGDQITTEDMNRVYANGIPSTSRPSDVFERMFAGKALETATTQPKDGGDHALVDATAANPSAADVSLGFARGTIARQQYAIKKMEEIRSSQTYAGSAIDVAEGLIPFLNTALTWNAFKQNDGTTWLPGTDLQEAQDHYYTMPEDKYQGALDGVVAGIAATNPTAALDFLQKMVSHSSSDRMWENLAPAIDASVLKPIAAMKTLFKTEDVLGTLLKNTTRAVATPKANAPQVLAQLGEPIEAGMTNAKKVMERQTGVTPNINTMAGIDSEALRVFQPETAVGGPTSALSRPITQAVSVMLDQNNKAFFDDVLRPGLRTDRLTDDVLAVGKQEADRVFRLQYPEANDSIHDVALANKADNLTNNDFIEVTLGKPNGEYFDSPEEAKLFTTERLGIEDASVRQLGDNKYTAIVTKPIDETSSAVLNQLDIATKGQTPVSRANVFLGWMKGSHSLTSEATTTDRVVAAFGASNMSRIAKKIYEPVGNLGKKDYNEMNKFLSYQRDYVSKDGQRGKYSSDVGAFERDWNDRFGKMPNDKQTLAYFAHTQLSDMDWVVRNMNMYTLKARKGVEQFEVNIGGAGALKLEGRYEPDIDWHIPQNAQIAILDDESAKNILNKSTTESLVSKNQLYKKVSEAADAKSRKEIIQDAIKAGEYRVIRLTDEGVRRIQNHPDLAEAFEDKHIDYALVGNSKTKPLDLKQIPYRPGGHVEYTNGSWFMRQANIEMAGSGANRVRAYKGDKTVLAFDTEAKAKKWLPKYEEARSIYAEVKNKLRPEDDLKNYIKANLPDSVKDFKEMFDKKGGKLDVNERLHVTPKGKSVGDVEALSARYKDGIPWEDAYDNPHSLFSREDIVKFAGEKDGPLLTIKERGTPAQPVLNYRPATLLDPISTMNHAASSLMRGRYMEDVKLKYAQHFLSEFGDVLDNSFREGVRDPYRALIDAKFKDNYADKARLAAAKNYRGAMVQFLGLRNEETKTWDWMRQQLADTIYKRGSDKQLDLVAPYLLHHTNDPVTFWKQFAFHGNLGLFNPKQLFLQAVSVANTAGIEGFARSSKGMAAGFLQMGLRHSNEEKMLASAADKAVAMGWNREHFLESTKLLRDSGFMNVGREISLQDGFFSPRLRNSKWGKFLDWGTTPFAMGEQTSRTTAWNASYLRWREANPGKTLDNRAGQEIIARANILTQNMSVANTASWQHGAMSIPTQFYSYRARLAEQLLGKQLTRTEKARLFGTNALLFGLPVGVGAAFPLAPVTEWVKEVANSYGYNMDDHAASKFANDGLMSVVIQAITGEDTNVEGTYGPGTIDGPYHFLMDGDYSVAKLLGGASGTVFGNIIANSAPFMDSLFNSIRDEEWPGQETTTQDIVNFASSISTVNNAQKAWYAAYYGKYYTKNQGTMADVDPGAMQIVLQGLLGLGPQAGEDMFPKMENIQAREAMQKRESGQAAMYYKLAYDALQKKDADTADKYFARAKQHLDWGGFTWEEKTKFVMQALKENRSVVDSVDWQWAKTSADRRDALLRERQGN